MRWISWTLLFLLFGFAALTQNETQKWFFGYNCGLDFSTDPPTVIPSPSFHSLEGGASISDAAGNLLFYTDGVTIWDRSHTMMANGNGLMGNQSSSQSSVIVPKPGSTTLFYVFTQEGAGQVNGLRFSTVDMSLAAGMGSVTVKNTFLFTPSCEKLAAVRSCSGNEVWVITHDLNSNGFRCFQVTAAGVNITPVLSSAGPVISGVGYSGVLKISPDGKKIAIPIYTSLSIELYDFNTSTGIVSNHFQLGGVVSYGCEFSADGSKFYAGQNSVYQWDLCQSSVQAIQNSSLVVCPTITLSFFGTYQLGLNNKIYISLTLKDHLSVIHSPEQTGAACNFTLLGQAVGSGTTTLGLPNFISNYFNPLDNFVYSMSCTTATFEAPGTVGCRTAPLTSTVSWDFGDPLSGSQNTSTLSNTTHQFSAPGTYTVTLFRTNSCGTQTIVKTVTTSPAVTVNNGFTICAGQSTVLTAGTADSYTWFPGGANTSTLGISPLSTTLYTVNATLKGCTTSATVEVTAIPPIQRLINFSYTPACLGSQISQPVLIPGFNHNGFFTAPDSLNVNAATGSIDLSGSYPGVYTVTYSIGPEGCNATETSMAELSFAEAPKLSGNDYLKLSPGTSTILSVRGGDTYTWNAFPVVSCQNCAEPGITPSESGRYCVRSDFKGCVSEFCVNVLVTCETSDLSLPNAFSPNGDGHNDAFCVEGWDFCVEHFSILIFNRWGEKVYESDKASFCWDGVYNGKTLESDVYIYSLLASFTNGKRVDRKGNVTLLR